MQEPSNPAELILGTLLNRDLDVRLVEALPWLLTTYPNLDWLSAIEDELERCRLAVEGTLCRESMPEAERCWLRSKRPTAAKHWHLLTDLTVKELNYAPYHLFRELVAIGGGGSTLSMKHKVYLEPTVATFPLTTNPFDYDVSGRLESP
jgi:hypothetical protein